MGSNPIRATERSAKVDASVADCLARAKTHEPFDAGGLELAPDLEGFARINISLAYGPGKKGPFFYYFKR